MDKKTILVVEDEPDMRKTLAFRLRKNGFGVALSGDGEEALRKARSKTPDLILLDLTLPRLSGEDVCKAIREDGDPFFSKTPIIMVTGKDSEADSIVGRVIGADAYLTKPFNSQELLEQIQALLAKASSPF